MRELPKVLLLDFDGTLVDSLPALYQVYLDFLAAHGKEGTRAEFESYNGPALHEFVGKMAAHHNLSGTLEEHLRHYKQKISEAYLRSPHTLEGVPAVLKRAHALGIRLMIVTASSREQVLRWMKRDALDAFFETVVTADDVEVGKPDPAVYLKALEIAQVLASEALAVEDARFGVMAATRAKIPTVSLRNRLDPNSLDKADQKWLVASLEDWRAFEDFLFEK